MKLKAWYWERVCTSIRFKQFHLIALAPLGVIIVLSEGSKQGLRAGYQTFSSYVSTEYRLTCAWYKANFFDRSKSKSDAQDTILEDHGI